VSQVRAVTRDVEPSTLPDLLGHPPRATVAFVSQEKVEVLPVRARHRADTYRFGVSPAAGNLEAREVVLVMDDGAYWFELRGISVRGLARRIAGEPEPAGLAWYAIEPRRILAWDYGTLREA
jgi:hypothetical protein